MSLRNHLDQLERKHEALERELADAATHPGTGEAKTTELKRRKLHLKDQLVRLKVGERAGP